MSVLAKSVHFHTLSASCSFTVFPVFTSTVHPYNIQFRTALSICNEKKPTMLRCVTATENEDCTFFILSILES